MARQKHKRHVFVWIVVCSILLASAVCIVWVWTVAFGVSKDRRDRLLRREHEEIQQKKDIASTILWIRVHGGQVHLRDPGVRLRDLESDSVVGIKLDDTQITDLTSLSEFRNIAMISLTDTQIRDLSPLSNLDQIESLWLSGSQVSDLSPLKRMKNLKWLVANNAPISDLTPLSNLKRLERLMLTGTQVSDLAPLTELTSLKTLLLANTKVQDISPLLKLKDLKIVHLTKTNVNDDDISALRNALPECSVTHESVESSMLRR